MLVEEVDERKDIKLSDKIVDNALVDTETSCPESGEQELSLDQHEREKMMNFMRQREYELSRAMEEFSRMLKEGKKSYRRQKIVPAPQKDFIV